MRMNEETLTKKHPMMKVVGSRLLCVGHIHENE